MATFKSYSLLLQWIRSSSKQAAHPGGISLTGFALSDSRTQGKTNGKCPGELDIIGGPMGYGLVISIQPSALGEQTSTLAAGSSLAHQIRTEHVL
jgi:hypothetical protein